MTTVVRPPPVEDDDPYLVQVTVCDSRPGRDHGLLTDEDESVLARFESEYPYNEGDLVDLPGGRHVRVLHVRELISKRGWFQLLHVEDVFRR